MTFSVQAHTQPAPPAMAAQVRPATPWLLLGSLPWLLLLGWLTSVTWFLCDDAFISFRYVRNLVEGHGLVFNPGEYVEGYTNFLWVLELAAIWSLLGIPPEHAAQVLSVIYTVGTLAAMLWWVYRLPGMSHRGLVGWMALGLVCSSATVAVWTSAGGLATRQFTFLLVVAVAVLSVHGTRRWGLLTASLSLGLAELTRPEGLLLGGLCLGGFAVCWMARERRLHLDPLRHSCARRNLAVMGGPFALMVAGHYLWRYSYYGEWLPNTYYAKYVAPWYDAGLRYLAQAGIDTGLYLLVPLALLAGVVRWRRNQDGTYAVILLLIGVHMNYLARIGGDHFEYRPLDFYWPLLAVAAAEGLLVLGTFMATLGQARGRLWVRRSPERAHERGRRAPQPASRSVRNRMPLTLTSGRNRSMKGSHRAAIAGGMWAVRAWALMLFAPVLLYTGAIQGALLYEGSKEVVHRPHMYSELNEGNAGRWLVAPGMSKLAAMSNTLHRESTLSFAPSPWMEHRAFFVGKQVPEWKPYEDMVRGMIPDDAVGQALTLGVESYYLPDLAIIDQYGLTDSAVARNPQTRAGRRLMAHERQPPPGYLKQRGVNMIVQHAARSLGEALSRASYALEVGPNLWMPFESDDHQWVAKRFAGLNLKRRSP